MEPVELHLKYRPKNFSDVVGQDEVIHQLQELGKSERMPHFIIFGGPSGTGKTTLSRIIAQKLGCEKADYQEINAAEDRGIDMVREIISTYEYRPLSGGVRVYVIDEAHALTPAAQDSFLKPLEEPPSHAYFFFCTTDPNKLKPTIRTRATRYTLKPLSGEGVATLVSKVAKSENVPISKSVIEKIVESSDGSARSALVLLHSVINIDDVNEQLRALDQREENSVVYDLAKAVVFKKSWREVAALLDTVKKAGEDVEQIRRSITGLARTMLLKDGKPYYAVVIEEFREPMFYIGHDGLAAASFAAVMSK